jgi:hypothetical protein
MFLLSNAGSGMLRARSGARYGSSEPQTYVLGFPETRRKPLMKDAD